MRRIVAAGVAVLAVATGVVFKDEQYRLRSIGLPSDQAVLEHRDSAYTSITWVGSPSENYLQLRFFDKVEGGVCLRPTWAELIERAKTDARLAHLVPQGARPEPMSAPRSWPYTAPDPGTLPNSAYVRFFPVGVLLNKRLMAAAGEDPVKVAPNILVVGLGSSVGVLGLAHHFPQASISVVDIDLQVEEAVRARVPLVRWLETQKTADGRPRLNLVAADARQYIRFDAKRRSLPYDLIILDAYTAGSTIPSHLMTQEFFAECADAMEPTHGILLANIIGSYTGKKHLVLSGALRSMRAGGLSEARTIPVLSQEAVADYDPSRERNHITVASRAPVDSRRQATGWKHLAEFQPFPELSAGSYVSAQYLLLDAEGSPISALAPAGPIEAALPAIRGSLRPLSLGANAPRHLQRARSEDRTKVNDVRQAVLTWAKEAGDTLPGRPLGWDREDAASVLRTETDWLLAAREVWRISILNARDDGVHGAEALVGPVDGPARAGAAETWRIPDVPLFTDQQPNADIVNQ
jgi:hypothetical protein